MKSAGRVFSVSVMALSLILAAVPQAEAQDGDIVDVAIGAGSFGTLVSSVIAGDLVDVLRSEGPFTVFAPTDEAFADLPPGTVESLLQPENSAQLVAILTYHVVPGLVLAEDVVGLTSAPTVNGQALTISVDDSGVKVDQATVIATDVMATNGVIHVIDQVLIPVDRPTAVERSTWGSIKHDLE